MFSNLEVLESFESGAPGTQKSSPRRRLSDCREDLLPLDGPTSQPGRRKYLRFPISMPAQYSLGGFKRATTTVNISRGGVFIHAKEDLPVGRTVRLAIDWPAALDGRCPLSLVVFGRVVRCQMNGTAISIHRYEFRLRPKPSSNR